MVQVAGVPRKAEERQFTYRAVEQIERHKWCSQVFHQGF